MNYDKEILALTGLRFVAALYVFVYHIHIRWPVVDNSFLHNLIGQGPIGMSLFFVLSGFVIAFRYGDGKSSLRAYLINRFARIYPIYAIAAILTLPWLGLSLPPDSTQSLVEAVLKVIILVLANIFVIQAWFPQFFDYWNNGGSWSISVEVFCYLLAPLFLQVLTRVTIKQLLLVVAVCYALVVMPGFVGTLFPASPRGVYYSMPIYRLPEFLIGMCACIAYLKIGGRRYLHRYQLPFILMIVFYLGNWGNNFPNHIGHNWILVPFIAVMIMSLTNEKGLLSFILKNPVSVWLGKLSYCFYSFQALVVLSLISYHPKLVEIAPLFSNHKFLLVFALMSLLGLSAIGYYFIEEPARRRIRMVG